ncbi:MAG: BatA domain-containing protein [bacterium]|nr:hypothetical protein [Planctomycetota bacterium]HIL51213.1 hypothetical protein [Planctomycetota bacterium]
MFEGFVNPALVAGGLLAAVPLIIHLFNRQRHKPVAWAAMRFVLAAHRRTRRRVQMENWLLLLLRMAAIALLALAVARPFTGSQGPLAGLTESRRDVAIIIDASASTGYRTEVETIFERITARAGDLLAELDGARGDRAHLVIGGAWARLAAWGDPAAALAILADGPEPSDEHFDLAAALAEVLAFAKEEAAGASQSRVEIWVLTDLQRSTFLADELGDPDYLKVADSLAALGLKIFIEDLGAEESTPPNLAVGTLKTQSANLGPGEPLDLGVRVFNHGTVTKSGVRVALEVDGVRRPSQVLHLPARSSAEAIFPLIFEDSGEHVVRALLEGDRLALDDERVRILRVPEPVRVAIINGKPAPEIERDAAGLLFAVLDPQGDDGQLVSPFRPKELRPRDLESGDVDLDDFDLIWLANVDSLTPRAVAALEERVAEGAALVISLGDEVLVDAFNARFYSADGAGLSPAELLGPVAVASRQTDYWRVKAFEREHPALELFAEERWRALLTEAPVWEFVATRPHDNAEILCQLDDPSGSALFLSRTYGRGSVYLWTSSIDESWTALPSWGPFLVPFVYDLVSFAGTPRKPERSLAPGAALQAEVAEFPRRVELVGPDGTARVLSGEPEKIGRDLWRLPAVSDEDTAKVGLYRITTESSEPIAFAVQLAKSESNLERLAPSEVEGLHEAFVLHKPGAQVDPEQALLRRGELWRPLAIAALCALVLESLVAAWIGRKRGGRA